MAVTLRQLRYFEALLAERHFARAAERAGVTQPALSTQIRELEAALGGPLVERGTPGLAPTPLGRAAAAHTARILTEVQALEALAVAAQGLGVPLALGFIPTIAPYLVPPFLPMVRAEGGRVSIREAMTETLLAELDDAALDAAVIALPVPRRGFAAAELFADRFLLALPPDAKAMVPPSPEDIDPQSLLLLDEGHCLSDQALAACKFRPQDRRVRLGAASLSTLARLVASGQGVTLVPEIAAATEGRGLRLEAFADPAPRRLIALVRPDRGTEPGWFGPLAGLLSKAGAAIPRPAV